MDIGNKTLSQLSDEAKEKRYVSLNTGAKISGYTKEYLERLCRLNKVEYRLWNHGEFVVELDSLLAETHAILLSYQDIEFAEKSLLMPDIAPTNADQNKTTDNSAGTKGDAKLETDRILSEKVATGITQTVPSFGGAESKKTFQGGASSFSIIGHAVISNPSLKEGAEEKKKISITPEPHQIAHEEHVVNVVAETSTPVHIPEVTHINISHDEDIPASSSDTLIDEWDSALLSENPKMATDVGSKFQMSTKGVSVGIASTPEYHPIQTSIDATVHHEDLPLFPATFKQQNAPLSQETAGSRPKEKNNQIPDLGADKRVIVFEPEKYVDHDASSEATHSFAERTTPTKPLAVPHAPYYMAPSYAPSPDSALSPEKASSLPLMKVMPQVVAGVKSKLPAIEGEHHLIFREKNPLIKSVGFNTAIALFLVGAGVVLVGGMDNSLFFKNDSSSLVAGVGAALGSEADIVSPDIHQQIPLEQAILLQFSDEIAVMSGGSDDSIIVQPVFRDTAGLAHEYTLPSDPSQ